MPPKTRASRKPRTPRPVPVVAAVEGPDLERSPVHTPGRRLRWTTANVDEGLPGTVTPLTWSLYFPPTESTMRDCWVDLGVMPESERAVPDDVDGRFISVAYGHAIANVDLMGQMAARIPGGSAAMMEEQLFGSVQGGGLPEPTGLRKMRRYPFVAVKFPRTLRRAMRALDPTASEIDAWWGRAAFGASDLDLAGATALLVEARAQFERVLMIHMVLSMACQGVMGQVETLATRAGMPELGHQLVKSEQGTAEFDLVRDLWRLSADEIDMDSFLRSHGYHGPREGLVESVSWREDAAMVRDLAARYRSRTGDMDGLVLRRREEHAAAVRRLEGALGRVRSVPARLLLRFASNAPDWRETGRASILRCVDVTRAASGTVGLRLVEEGVLSAPGEVRFLTIDELVQIDRATVRSAVVFAGRSVAETVAARRADHQAYDALSLPHVWHGLPTVETVVVSDAVSADGPAKSPGASQDGLVVTGLGVSAGVAEGIVRVVTDLDEADFDDGTVMVCKATDPSWASLFPLAEAVVTDVGSAMSHAAIVCRELGLPCVANTRTGTTQLRDGMRVRVDGSAGTVEVIG
ncbi:PEP-utilizing enzyme [Nocardioides sp. WS12]|uniref:PEP-utilizing enzyme n=1 Tax=Nocardioides sp. WS12 TaxID=2486272 RepID=UPI0015F8A089|nr:PEP-utilizing enzyme [Nocardioides sp. WS12]